MLSSQTLAFYYFWQKKKKKKDDNNNPVYDTISFDLWVHGKAHLPQVGHIP